ncbi:MAG: hypothetical protein SangKO_068660 [Sandaracinaceae bacterium]
MLTSFLGDTGRDDAEGIMRNVNRATEGLAETLDNEQTQQDVRDIVHNLAVITRARARERRHRAAADDGPFDGGRRADVAAASGARRTS